MVDETASFVHLRVHSEYSVVDGLIHHKALMGCLKDQGMDAVAITDESNLFGAIKFYRAACAAGIKPIIGADIWVMSSTDDTPTRLSLLCQNNTGYFNLIRLLSQGYLSGERRDNVPLIRRSWLTKEALTGLIALSGACHGDIGQALIADQTERAKTWLKNWLVLFPDQRFYIEVQRVGHVDEDVYLPAAVALAAEQQLPIVATQDVRFIAPEEFNAHEIRVAIHDGYTMDDPRRPKRYQAQQYLADAQTMRERFADLPAACDNTVELAKRCNVELELDQPQLPRFPTPEGVSEDEFLRMESQRGLAKRLAAGQCNPDNQAAYEKRLTIELDVIISMGFPGYFLIVADFIRWSKDNGVPVGPGRGSGAGSLVAYALEITDLDPLPYDLLFERFLNPERVSMPDFDIDFCMDGRDRVIDYVAERYGRDSVSQIATFGTMAAKAVVRDVGRVMGHGYGFVDGIAKLIPMELGITLQKALDGEEKLKSRYDSDEEVRAIIDMGLVLEGTVRNIGKHAGGVVIAPSCLTDFTPLYCETGSPQLVSQYDKNDVEAAGLVKFDFLGLRNLTIIQSAVDIINAVEPERQLDITEIPLDDAKTFSLLKRCDTTAVFQLESRGMKDLIHRLQPDCFEDIIALVALFRPGPLQSGMVDDFINRKHGRAEVAYPHPDTEEILKPTYGIILYQEQVMKLAQVLAGYTLGAADLLRRAMGKKKPEEMAKQREIFTTGAIDNQVEEKTATYIFDLMEKFAGYGFNKSHSAAYALVAYQTAWLKAHYPAAFMAAVLSSDMDNTDKVVIFLEDCEQLDVEVLAPDVQASHYKFTVEAGKVRYGLGAVKGVGEAAIEVIVAEREQQGAYRDLFDFCQRIDLRKVNKRVLEALVYAGALDGLGPNRESIFASLGAAVQAAEQISHNQQHGQDDLFSGCLSSDAGETQALQFVEAKAWKAKERLLQEKAVLGVFFSGHPITEDLPELERMRICRLSGLRLTAKDDTIKIAGIITGSRRLKTKRGEVMRIITLDDQSARIDVIIFPSVLATCQDLVKVDDLVVIDVSVSQDHFTNGLRAAAKQVMTLPQAQAAMLKQVNVSLSEGDFDRLPQLKALIEPYRGGACRFNIQYRRNTGLKARLNFANEWQLTPDAKCLEGLQALFSSKALAFVY